MSPIQPFEGRVITITGGARGIGLAIARYLAERGANICISDILKTDVDLAAAELSKDFPNVKIHAAEVDVANSVAVEKWFLSVKEEMGKIDGAVNNAGVIGPIAPLTTITDDQFQRVLSINLYGLFYSLRSELKIMERGSSIVNIASVAGLTGVAGFAPYISSKHAAVGLTKVAAKEAGEKEIRVNAVCPGLIKTAMFDEIAAVAPAATAGDTLPQVIKRPGMPEEIAALVAYLLGDESKFTTGSQIVIDGGTLC